MIGNVFSWLTDPGHWRGGNGLIGIGTQLQAHITYSFVAVAIALAIALPLGLFIGHTGRLAFIVSAANTLRALPTVGVLVLLTVMISPNFHGRTDFGYLIPTEIVLVLIAIPPILSNTYAGVQNVDGAVRDAASAMGMTGSQVLRQVEFPCSLPLIFSGLRSASLQVIATATIASYLPLGGLGRFIYDGLAQQDFPQMIGGGVLVALLALLTDSVLAFIQRHVVSRGVSGRFSKKAMPARGPAAADIVEAEVAAV
ncbi:MAG TPA: ABC transporter permease [Acidothermaceae bacterium]|jgi:osmoprotectant transport system permease protein